jgi:hypothetical protein
MGNKKTNANVFHYLSMWWKLIPDNRTLKVSFPIHPLHCRPSFVAGYSHSHLRRWYCTTHHSQ